jgi:uncharacterized delta-60 repeat protein
MVHNLEIKEGSMGIAHSRLGKFLTIFLSFLGLVMLGSTPAQGGGAGSLDPSFQSNANLFPVPAIRGKVNYGDGRSLLYGNFIIAANGKPYSNLVRLNADGSVDTNFDFPLREGTDVRAVCLLPGGQILVGGTFGLRRLNSDGSVDDTLSGTVTTPYGTVNALAMQTDGKILVGGCSLRVQGDTTNSYHLVRLRSDWTLDSVYPNRIGAGGNVNSIELLNDDPLNPDRVRIYGTLPGLSHNDFLLVLYSNGFEQWSIGSETVNGPIYAMVAQPNGKLVVAGQFTIAKGASYNGIVRLNSDLSLDNDFTIGTGFGGGQVSSLVLQDDGKIVAAGNFTSFNGAPCGYITRLQAGGSIDGTFSAGTGANDRIFRMEADGGNLRLLLEFQPILPQEHCRFEPRGRSHQRLYHFQFWLLVVGQHGLRPGGPN